MDESLSSFLTAAEIDAEIEIYYFYSANSGLNFFSPLRFRPKWTTEIFPLTDECIFLKDFLPPVGIGEVTNSGGSLEGEECDRRG